MKNAFVDSNILVYAADQSTTSDRKRLIARELLRTPNLQISVQVLSEFVASARHPKKLALTLDAEKDWLAAWLKLSVTSLTPALFIEAIRIHHEYHLSHWDSLIVATALSLKCPAIFTEDLQHGQVIEGMKIINPFF